MDSLFAAYRKKVPAEDLVMRQIDQAELFSPGSLHPPAVSRKHNLGSAILLAAIEDYQGLNEEMHEHAKRFLFPETQEWREHYEWVVSLAEGVNPAWVRRALDQAKSKWDEQRVKEKA